MKQKSFLFFIYNTLNISENRANSLILFDETVRLNFKFNLDRARLKTPQKDKCVTKFVLPAGTKCVTRFKKEESPSSFSQKNRKRILQDLLNDFKNDLFIVRK